MTDIGKDHSALFLRPIPKPDHVAERKHKTRKYKPLPQSRPDLQQDRAMSDPSNPLRLSQLIKFGISGVIAFIVDASLFTVFSALGFSPALARLPSIFAAIFTTWAINRYWTFTTTKPPSLSEFLQYVLAMGLGLAINYGTFLLALATSETIRANPILGLALATIVAMSVNFLTARFLLNR